MPDRTLEDTYAPQSGIPRQLRDRGMHTRAYARAGAFGPTIAEQRQAYRAALGEAIRVRPSRTLGRGLPAIDCPTQERASTLHARRAAAQKAEQRAAIAAREANRPLKPPGVVR